MAQISLSSKEQQFIRIALLSKVRDCKYAVELDKRLLSSASTDEIDTYSKILTSDLADLELANSLYDKFLDLIIS